MPKPESDTTKQHSINTALTLVEMAEDIETAMGYLAVPADLRAAAFNLAELFRKESEK